MTARMKINAKTILDFKVDLQEKRNTIKTDLSKFIQGLYSFLTNIQNEIFDFLINRLAFGQARSRCRCKKQVFQIAGQVRHLQINSAGAVRIVNVVDRLAQSLATRGERIAYDHGKATINGSARQCTRHNAESTTAAPSSQSDDFCLS